MRGTNETGGSAVIEAARRGERWAEEEITATIQRFARHLCRGGAGAAGEPEWEDVAQEACRRFFTSGLARFRAGGPEKSYLYSIVKATRIQLYRGMVRRKRRELAAQPEERVSASPEARTLLSRILSRLPDACRDLLERTFFDGASSAELAGELGLAESSVRSRLTRCLQKARAEVA